MKKNKIDTEQNEINRFSDTIAGKLIPATKKEKVECEQTLLEHYRMLANAANANYPSDLDNND